MLPIIPKPPITRRQKALAMSVAGFVDLLQIAVAPALFPGYAIDDALDFIAAVALMAICGFKWQFVLAFMLELTPVLDLLPTWTAVALLLPVSEERHNVRPSVPSASHSTFVEVQAIAIPPVQAGHSTASPKVP